MEITLRNVMQIIPLLLSITLSVGTLGTWGVTATDYVNKSLEAVEMAAVDVNSALIGKSYPIIYGDHIRVNQSTVFIPTDHITCIDETDGDLTAALVFYGDVNMAKKGKYELKCVAVNSLGLKTVKYVWILVD